MPEWSQLQGFFVTVLLISSIAGAILNFIKLKEKVDEPIQKVTSKLEVLDERVDNLEKKIIEAESDREDLHVTSRLTVKALQSIMSKDEKKIDAVSSELEDYLRNNI